MSDITQFPIETTPISALPSLGAGGMSGDVQLVVNDPNDTTESGTGTTKKVTYDAANYFVLPRDGRTVATLGAYLGHNAVFNVLDYASLTEAHAACLSAGGGTVVFAAGTYPIVADFVFDATVHATFIPGALLNVTDGVTVSFTGGITAPRTTIFSLTGTQLIGGTVYPDWWGVVPDQNPPTTNQCIQNTAAFRKAFKSIQSEWVAQQGFYQVFSVDIAAGRYDFANGFTVPPGIAGHGSGVGSTLFYRYTANANPAEATLPLISQGCVLTGSGMSLAIASTTGITSVAPPPSFSDAFLFTESTTAMYFQVSGAFISRLWFSACSTGIQAIGAADLTWSDITFDGCTQGAQLRNCYNVVANNVLFYFCHYDWLIQSDVSDVQVANYHSEYNQYSAIYYFGGATGVTDVVFTAPQFVGDTQYGTMVYPIAFDATGCDLTLVSPTFRNIPGYMVGSVGGSGNTVTLTDPIFNAAKTRPAYAQGTTMGGIQANSLTVRMTNPTFQNLYASPVNMGGSANTAIDIEGGRVLGGTFTPPVLAITNSGTSSVRVRGLNANGLQMYNSPSVAVNGRQVLYLSAPPASGSYQIGDITWNTASASGGTPGWSCTTAGAPGTWKAMANLA